MNVNSILEFDKSGKLYKDLNHEQKEYLEKSFFQRKPTKNEMGNLYRYHFDGNKCTHAT